MLYIIIAASVTLFAILLWWLEDGRAEPNILSIVSKDIRMIIYGYVHNSNLSIVHIEYKSVIRPIERDGMQVTMFNGAKGNYFVIDRMISYNTCTSECRIPLAKYIRHWRYMKEYKGYVFDLVMCDDGSWACIHSNYQ